MAQIEDICNFIFEDSLLLLCATHGCMWLRYVLHAAASVTFTIDEKSSSLMLYSYMLNKNTWGTCKKCEANQKQQESKQCDQKL